MSDEPDLFAEPLSLTWLRRAVVAASVVVGALCLAVWARDTEALDGMMIAYGLTQAVTGVLVATMVPLRLVTLQRGAKDRAMTRRLTGDVGLLCAAALGQVVIGLALYPLTFVPGESPDPLWFLAVPAIVLLGVVASGCGYLVLGLLGLVPAAALVSRLPAAARGNREARGTVVAGGLLVLIVPLALSLMLSGAAAPRVGGRAGIGSAVLALLGIGVEQHAWIWVARGIVVACGLLVWAANRQDRQDRERGPRGE